MIKTIAFLKGFNFLLLTLALRHAATCKKAQFMVRWSRIPAEVHTHACTSQGKSDNPNRVLTLAVRAQA